VQEVVIDTLEAVAELLQEVAEGLVIPRFRRLREADIEEKAPGELVTAVDRAVEAVLRRRLPSLLPGSRHIPVVGEEAVAANPGLLDHLQDQVMWLVDPIDGTGNFVHGNPDFAIMVALLRRGETVASWILAPVSGRLTLAEKGSGCWQDGRRIKLEESAAADGLPGVLYSRFLPEHLRQGIEEVACALSPLSLPRGAAGIEYPRLLSGEIAYLMFWRTLPWDHVPGTFMVREAGGRASRPDGSAYRVGDDKRGLLVAPNEAGWQRLRALAQQAGVR